MIMALLWKTNCLFTAFDTGADLGGGCRGCANKCVMGDAQVASVF